MDGRGSQSAGGDRREGNFQGAAGGSAADGGGVGCGVHAWRRCVVKRREESSELVIVEWDEAGGEVSQN